MPKAGRSPIEILLDAMRMEPVSGASPETGLPYVTHEGVLKIGAIEIKVFQLSTGERVIPAEEFERLLP